MKKLSIVFCLIFLESVFSLHAALPYADGHSSARMDSILKVLRQTVEPELGPRVDAAAEILVNSGKDDYYFTDSVAVLRVDMNHFTPMGFINNVIALAKTSLADGGNRNLFEENLINYSCKRGENNGFQTIMWHSSDWLGDNIYRGNVEELTDNFSDSHSKTKSLDYMTRHRDKFAILSNPDIFEKIRMNELGFRNHKIPYIPRQVSKRKDFEDEVKDGDIVILIPNAEGEDYYNIGFLKKESDGIHLIHFDARKGRVVKEDEPLPRYLNLVAKYVGGFRLIRLK